MPDIAASYAADGTVDIDAEAQRQKTALLFRNAGLAQSVNVFNATLLAYFSSTQHVSVTLALAWWACFVSIAGWRYGLARRFHAATPTAATATNWRRRYLVFAPVEF